MIDQRLLARSSDGSSPCRSKSSCAASSCTCYRAELCASATPAFSPTGGEQNFFRFVCGCFSHPIIQRLQLPRRRLYPFPRCGDVRFAAEPCKLSNASPPRNSSSDLHLIAAGAPHESTSPASNLSCASARTLALCLAFLRTQCGGALQTLRRAGLRPFSLPPATATEAHRQREPPRKRLQPPHRETNPHCPAGRLPSSRCI